MATMYNQKIVVVSIFLCAIIFPILWLGPYAGHRRKVEYVAVVPNGQGPIKSDGPYRIDWVEMSYPEYGRFYANDVHMRQLPPNAAQDLVGGWRNNDLGSSGAMLTGRLCNDNLYVFINTGRAPIARGCCADTLRIFPRGGGPHRDILLIDRVRSVVNSIRGAHFEGISHAFHPRRLSGETHFLFPILYRDSRLGGLVTDGVICLNINTLDIRRTADGELMFSPFRRFGTLETAPSASVFKVQYKSRMEFDELQQWHLDCIITFVAKDGTDILGLAQRMDVEALLVKDPWKYRQSEGGGDILQRFGSPPIFDKSFQNVGHHDFGVKHQDSLPLEVGNPAVGLKPNGGLHNLYYHIHSNGRETITIFCNQLHGKNKSGVVEFDLKLVHDHDVAATDSVFDTVYTLVELPFSAMAQGGARPIGNGIYIVASGIAGWGYMIADTSGALNLYNYSNKLLYDPFVFVPYNRDSPVNYKGLLGAGFIVTMACTYMVIRMTSSWRVEKIDVPYMAL